MKLGSVAATLAFLSAGALSANAEVGFSQFTISGPAPVPVALWYPTDATPSSISRGPFVFSGAENAAPIAEKLPLVVVSHGAGSGMFTHSNLAVYLAGAGYAVATPTHINDNFRDDTGSGTAEVIASRARTVTDLIDRITAPNPLGLQIDADRISVIGFSAGGATALALAGARPVMAQAKKHCVNTDDPFCRFIGQSDPRLDDTTPIAGLGDGRLRSIVLLAPVTAYYADTELKNLSIPMFVFAPARDTELSPVENAARLRDLAPLITTYYQEPDAGHFSILPVFTSEAFNAVPEALRSDIAGFDRAQFQGELFERIVSFLNQPDN